MNLITYDELRTRMNSLGQAGIPFVWVVDYACEKCIILDRPFKSSDIIWEINGVGNAPHHENTGQSPSIDIVNSIEFGFPPSV